MNKYIAIAFAFLGLWFYEASGGADFEPGDNSLVVFAEPKPVMPRTEPRADRVARADTSSASLTDLTPARLMATPDPAEDTAPPVARTEPEPALVVAEPEVFDPEPAPDYRFVEGERVNLRGGPGTDYAVVGQLLRNDMVEVLEDTGEGWLHLRVTASGDEGWMADWLVTAAN